MLRKFRGKSLRVEKTTATADALATPVGTIGPYCHTCGQKTPNQSTFGGSFSSSNKNRASWNSFSASDSGYESFASGGSQTSGSQAGDGHSVVSIPSVTPPRRQNTYTSSVYSNDDDEDLEDEIGTVEPFPIIIEEANKFDFDLPPRTLSNYSDKWKPKSRYAKLNELPVASPRSLYFSEEVFDLSAGIERDVKSESKRRSRWHRASLSVSTLPTHLKRLSLGNLKKEEH